MYYYFESTIKMDKAQAMKSRKTVKNAIATTSISEDFEGVFDEMQNAVRVSKGVLMIDTVERINYDTCEKILPEILCAIANNGTPFNGTAYWYSDYDTEYFEFNFDGEKLTLTATYHSIDDEPQCDCEDEGTFIYDEELNCYICCECGEQMSEEEYFTACETTTTTVFNF